MIRFLDILSTLFTVSYGIVFFWMLKTFLPLRDHLAVKIIAFVLSLYISDVIIYSNDFAGLFGAMFAFFVYILIFYRGTLVEKLSVVLLFYPVLIAVNYLMLDLGSNIFFGITHVSETPSGSQWLLLSTAIHTASLLARLLFWLLAWALLRKYLSKLTSQMTVRMWGIVDMLMLSSFVAIFTIIYFMPENSLIEYPICIASVISSFGCMYLASYICDATQTAYRVQQMEMQSDYYKQKIEDETRVRSIYHDMKNHLLILEHTKGQELGTQEAIRSIQEQIHSYEDYYHTGNECLDIIIRDKARLAKEKGIDFNVLVCFDGMLFLEALDISTIFGNALDNAIEASEKLPEDQRLITVKANRVQEMLVISIRNNTEDAVLSEKSSKRDSFVHGFGLANIRAAVEKYDGQCSTSVADGVFTLKIIIPIP